MTGKEILLLKLKNYIDAGELQRDEIVSLLDEFGEQKIQDYNDNFDQKTYFFSPLRSISILIAFVITALLIVMGLGGMSFPGQVFITLGVGVVSYISSIFLFSWNERIIPDFFAIFAALLLPLGVIMIIDHFNITYSLGTVYLGLSLLLFALYSFSFYFNQKETFFVLGLIFFIGFFYSVIEFFSTNLMFSDYALITGVFGVFLVLFWSFISKKNRLKIPQSTAFIGGVMFYASLFVLVKERMLLFYGIFLLAGLLFSIYRNSKAIFFASILFSVLFVLYLSHTYGSQIVPETFIPLFLTAIIVTLSLTGFFLYQNFRNLTA